MTETRIGTFALLATTLMATVGGVARADDSGGRDWWAFAPLRRPEVPGLAGDDARRARNPIDHFIFAKLRELGLAPSPDADRRTLIRRLSFDLTGLPPAPAEIDAFVNDAAPGAYGRLVERLLASPRYGERWARHWLDVVHYADTHGYDKDKPRPNAWPYRDYVIRAFNDDKPYARFVREQLAGDVLYPGTADGIVATGFIAAGPWDFIGHVEVPEDKIDGRVARNLDRDDMVTTTMGTFCSVTVQCARCHDHKFDPINQQDYYRLQAVFAALDRADRPYDRDPKVARERARLTARRDALVAKQAGPREGDRHMAAALAGVENALAALPAQSLVYAGTVYSGDGSFRGTGANGGKPRAIHVLARGDVRKPQAEVGPGTLALIPGVAPAFDLPDGADEGDRRVALAEWITRPDNPLTWRSIVNRVWLYHFGAGIVDTPNDFGHMGGLPSHPKLLDWLAVEFRDGGRSIKDLHRLIVASATYRQISDGGSEGQRIDSGNRYLWRMTRRKLEAEAVRDTMLWVADDLDETMFGPGFKDFVIEKPEHSPHYLYSKFNPADKSSHRRSIYRFIVRSQPHPFLTTLDCADPAVSVPKRDQTLTALQALAMLHNPFVLQMADDFAARLISEADDTATRIHRAYRLTLGRSPTQSESARLAAFIADHGLPAACRLLFNLNEFHFVE